ncbi:17495_t:CDS:2, partial [Funneliformis caledonium]
MEFSYFELVFGSLICSILFILMRRERQIKLNEPPLVYYKYPIIGHTIDYYKDNEKFIKECYEKYGEIFSIYVFGKIITLVGGEFSSEIFKNHKDFSFSESNEEFLPLHSLTHRPNELVMVIQKNLTGDLKYYTNRVQRQLLKSIDEIIGDGKVLQPPLKSFQFIIAKPVAASVAEELSDDKELINSFAYAIKDIASYIKIPPILNFIHPNLHREFIKMLFRYPSNPFKYHRKIIKQKITPVVEKRLSEMKKLDGAYVPPVDILQKFIELYGGDIDTITDSIVTVVFASIHTTSTFITHALQEEQEQLFKSNENEYYSIEQIAKMEKLDSMLKETLRVYAGVLPHKLMSPYYTFSSGHQVPK